jgi:hypothetical protein
MRLNLKVRIVVLLTFILVVCGRPAFAETLKAALDQPIPRGAKVFISPVAGGWETYLAAGLQKKQVPVVIVGSRDMAQYEISGVAESEKAGWAKILFMKSAASMEQAGIKVTNIETNEVVFAYAVHKENSVRGKQSAAEACAKHMKEKIESK